MARCPRRRRPRWVDRDRARSPAVPRPGLRDHPRRAACPRIARPRPAPLPRLVDPRPTALAVVADKPPNPTDSLRARLWLANSMRKLPRLIRLAAISHVRDVRGIDSASAADLGRLAGTRSRRGELGGAPASERWSKGSRWATEPKVWASCPGRLAQAGRRFPASARSEVVSELARHVLYRETSRQGRPLLRSAGDQSSPLPFTLFVGRGGGGQP